MARGPGRVRVPRDAPILPSRRGAAAGGNANDRILAVVRRIPRGRVATYGQIATAAGFPRAPRLAGYALHALPAGTPIPWHRVVGAGGRLSLARLSPDGALTQRMRLEREGVRFDPRGRVDLARCGWGSKPSGRR
jgi:methylated-DNA-protein-cysteine methyltransferase-like protein